MGAYSLSTLVRKWGRGELTVEQVVGQILLHLQELQETVASLERRVYYSTRPGPAQGSVGTSGRRRWSPEEGEDNEERGS
jgi:hypothetical protein